MPFALAAAEPFTTAEGFALAPFVSSATVVSGAAARRLGRYLAPPE